MASNKDLVKPLNKKEYERTEIKKIGKSILGERDIKDITDIEVLRKSLSRYQQITSKIHEFLWSVIYEDGIEDIFYTQSTKKITGYTPSEIKNMPGRGSAIIFEEDREDVNNKVTEFENCSCENELELIYRIVKKSSEVIWIRENISVERNEDGKIIRYDGIVSDINEIKKAEESLRKSEESFRQLNKAKDRFISIISHDLRAPFTSILGFSEILLNEEDLPDSDKQEYLSYIYESSQNQLQLVNYLLDYSRLQTGRIKLELQRIKTNTLVHNCVSSLTGNSIRKNISIKTSVPDDLYIQADERLITQALTNLLSNAIKFTKENKSIYVTVKQFKDGLVEFVVKDEGVGITEGNKPKLFHFDQKFTCEGTKGEKGTGLGLTLVKEIVEKHGGEIWFLSELGSGSEFHFTVPEVRNYIILVENEDYIKTLLKNNIQKRFPIYEVVELTNGYEALELIQKNIPVIVITDHDIPLMNGIQFVDAIRKKDEKNRIPVVVIADGVDEEIKSTYNKLGVDSVLIKPIDINSFEDTLLNLVH